MPRSCSLKASAVCAFRDAAKPYMKRSAVRYSTRRPEASMAWAAPCRRCLSQTDIGMHEKRIEHGHFARLRLHDLHRGGMRHDVRTADLEAREHETTIQRRADLIIRLDGGSDFFAARRGSHGFGAISAAVFRGAGACSASLRLWATPPVARITMAIRAMPGISCATWPRCARYNAAESSSSGTWSARSCSWSPNHPRVQGT